MKKTFLVLAVVLVSVCAFAAQNASFAVVPYSLGLVSNGDEHVTSKYGFGGKVALTYDLPDSDFAVGGELEAGMYTFEEGKLIDVALAAKAVHNRELSSTGAVFSFLKYGAIVQFYKEATSLNQVVGLGAGYMIKLDNSLSLFLSPEVVGVFGYKDKVLYQNYKLNCTLGVQHSL